MNKITTLKQFIGQSRVKKLVQISIKAAKKLNKSVDHILLYAPPGLGKTTLAKIIANEMKSKFVAISAPTITKPSDIISILNSLKENDVLFIDEVQTLPKNVEEILYVAMEEFLLRFIYENEENSKPIELELPSFTLIAATTKLSNLSLAFRSRFSIKLNFDNYTIDDIKIIIKNLLNKNKILYEEEAIDYIASHSRNNPRNANNLVKRVVDFYCIKNNEKITLKIAREAISNLNIYEEGLTNVDVKILKSMKERFKGGPTSIEAISNVINESLNDIEVVYEPYLVQEGYIDRTKRGRIITKKALDFLNKNALFSSN